MSSYPSKFFAFLLIAALTTIGTADAETVELLNGDIVHGKVLSLDAQILKLRSESFGDLNIKRETVATIQLHDRGPRPKQAKAADRPRAALDRVQSPDEVSKQLQLDGGINAEDMKAVQQKFPLLATPEVKGFVSERLSGLLSGKINILDIRKEAVDAVDQIKDIQKDLGPQAGALSGYLSILENFIQETEQKPKDVSKDRKPEKEK